MKLVLFKAGNMTIMLNTESIVRFSIMNTDFSDLDNKETHTKQIVVRDTSGQTYDLAICNSEEEAHSVIHKIIEDDSLLGDIDKIIKEVREKKQ